MSATLEIENPVFREIYDASPAVALVAANARIAELETLLAAEREHAEVWRQKWTNEFERCEAMTQLAEMGRIAAGEEMSRLLIDAASLMV